MIQLRLYSYLFDPIGIPSVPTTWTSRYSVFVAIYAVSVLAIAVASLFPQARIWGLNWYAYADWNLRIMALLPVISAPLFLTAIKYKSRVGRKVSAADSAGRSTFRWAVVIGALMFASFVLFSARTHFLGDGFQLLYRLAEGTSPIRPWNPAVYWIQGWVYNLLGGDGVHSALVTFQLISYVSGFFFLVLTLWAAWRLFELNLARLLFFLGALSGGYMLVFFGYVENYPVFILVVTAFTLLGMLAARGKVARWWILLPLATAIPLHPFSAALVAPAVYLMTQRTPVGRWVAARAWWLKLAAVLVLLATGMAIFIRIYTTDYFFRFAIVPFVEDRFTIEGYSMFGAKHLVDLFNLIWQYQPGILLGIMVIIGARFMFKLPEYLFLALQVAASFGIVMLFDPKLGMPRDWDMFCFAGIPLTFLILLAALDSGGRTTATLRAAGLVAVLGLTMIVPRVACQAIPDSAIAMFDNYSNFDIFKCAGGRFLMLRYLEQRGDHAEAERRRTANEKTAQFELMDVEAQQMMNRREFAAATERYRQLLKRYPSFHNAWSNLAICYYRTQQYDSAIACLQIADGLNPFSENVYHHLAMCYFSTGQNQLAEEYWLRAKE